MNSYVFLLINFLLTFILETIVYLIFIRDKKIKIILYCFLINAFTWPLANFFYSFLGMFYLIEFLVFVIEGFLVFELFNLSYKKAFLISFLSNLITAYIGFSI